MAQVVLITDRTHRPGANEVGDIVGVFESGRNFSSTERDGRFEIIDIQGITKDELETALRSLRPLLREGTTEKGEWSNDGTTWYKIKRLHKYPFSFRRVPTNIKVALPKEQVPKATKLAYIATYADETIRLDLDNYEEI